MFESALRMYTGTKATGAAMMSKAMGTHELDQYQSGPVPGFSADFRRWLEAHGYGEYGFMSSDRPGFGGKTSPDEKVTREPVVFVHGNSGSARDYREAREAFLAEGYKPSELYALTYDEFGPDKAKALSRYHSREFLTQIRAFIQAVKEYTGASKVDVVSHSLGVTLTRGAIRGGEFIDHLAGGRYDLGAPLTSSVDTFVGAAGANRGLSSCSMGGKTLPVCGLSNGLNPSSAYLGRLRGSSGYEGDKVFSLWSTEDDLIGPEARRTSPIPGEDASVRLPNHSHFGLIKETGPLMVRLVRDHAAPEGNRET